jgi:hypothetical protein
MACVFRAVGLTGHSFDASLRTFGITPMLERLMRLAGLQEIQRIAHAVNYSSGFPAHQAMYENFRIFFQLFQPFGLKVREIFPDAGIPDQGRTESALPANARRDGPGRLCQHLLLADRLGAENTLNVSLKAWLTSQTFLFREVLLPRSSGAFPSQRSTCWREETGFRAV